jgi:hypothetical protein
MTGSIAGVQRWIFVVFTSLIISPAWSYQGTNYSDNLSDIRVSKFSNAWQGQPFDPVPIGDVGAIEVVADLRGFIPMSFVSAEASGFLSLTLDPFRWYKVPVKKALLMLYYGKLKSSQLATDIPKDVNQYVENVRVLDEYHCSKEKADIRLWCRAAYDAEKDSKALLQKLSGGYDSAEPVLVFTTKDSSFIVLSLRYSDLLRSKGTGQVLVAIEFSRTHRQYKTFYTLYSTTILSPSVREFVAEYGPAMAKIAASIAVEMLQPQ